MHRIDTPGATNDNRFKTTPLPATRVGHEWLNATQEEIVNVIIDPTGGNMSLNKGDNTQLLDAIVAMIGRAVSASIPNKTLSIAGIVIKWGSGTNGVNNFPTPFPTACDVVVFSLRSNPDDGDESDEIPYVSSKTVNGFTVATSGADWIPYSIDWIAIGR